METHTEASPVPLGYPSTPTSTPFQKEVTIDHLDAVISVYKVIWEWGASRTYSFMGALLGKKRAVIYNFDLLRLWSKRREPLSAQEAKQQHPQ